ncbi:hypothetical protein MLD38_007502 [Melastoma candidum]|uniref:Uncharacterized protein n=1 Tax=Melastoma candidum TaxID=119954 RepID=A0ACB9RR17_9MYRT|nr:hypothetical protein MLD38_007502 [Melastoma candidum]
MQQRFKAGSPATANHEAFFHPPPPFFLRDDDFSRNHLRFSDLGELERSVATAFHQDEAVVDLSPGTGYSLASDRNALSYVGRDNIRYGGFDGDGNIAGLGRGGGNQLMGDRGGGCEVWGNGNCMENWGDSGIAPENSQHTDTSTDVDTEDKNHSLVVQRQAPLMAVDSVDQSRMKMGDVKILRRLAQNREAARKSRLRKKAYVQQLENSRLRLVQLEQELLRVRQQGVFGGSGHSADYSPSVMGNGAIVFDMEYARWLDEHQRLVNDLRSGVNTQMNDSELRILVDALMIHYDEVFRLKKIAMKADVFYILSGMWKTPTERCFMWLGGFRSSELLKIIGNQLEPLTEQQVMGICNLQQSSQQAEDALSQGMEALQQSLVETLSSTNLCASASSGNVADYMGQMAIAMSKLSTLETFLLQADLLRQQTLRQMHRILTTRQAARFLLVINDYVSRLRALSSLWLARPKD